MRQLPQRFRRYYLRQLPHPRRWPCYAVLAFVAACVVLASM